MVGYDKNEARSELSLTRFGLAAGFGGMITRCLCQPLDVVKIRFQLQVEPLSNLRNAGKYKTVLQTFKTIAIEEGISSLWKGHVPAQLLTTIYGIAQFVAFEGLTKQLSFVDSSFIQNAGVHFICGTLAGSIATIVSFPFDVIRTRFVAQGSTKTYHNLSEAVLKMYAAEGYRSFFRGLTPTIIQAAPYGGAQFLFYNMFTKSFKTVSSKVIDNKESSDSVAGNVIAGFLTGICSKTVVYPFDVCRKRMQIQGFTNIRKDFGEQFTCNGFLDCAYKIYRKESFSGLYKGLKPSLLKASIATALNFTLYEYFVHYFTVVK